MMEGLIPYTNTFALSDFKVPIVPTQLDIYHLLEVKRKPRNILFRYALLLGQYSVY